MEKIYTKESLIQELKNIRNKGWIENLRNNNNGAVGNTLEDLLGIEENNLPIPNAAEWELKAQLKNTTSLLTLSHIEPSPTACKIVSRLLLPNFGWKHKKAGINYPKDEKSFRQTISTKIISDRGFSVNVNHIDKKIEINFDINHISEKHNNWKQYLLDNNATLNPKPYFGFNDIFHKIASKLHNCFYVEAERKIENKKVYFSYQKILMLKNISVNKFIKLLEEGNIYIDFDARTGHNHGTKFRMPRKYFPALYEYCIEI